MFRGSSNINLDAKGRLAIPTRYRGELEECCARQMILTVGVNEKCTGEEGCLWLYPLPEWEILEKKINGLASLNKSANKLRRFLIGNACECEMDGQGRLLIPENLRKFAGMEKHIVFIGQLNKFEIWNQQAWQAKEADWMSGGDDEGLDELSDLSF